MSWLKRVIASAAPARRPVVMAPEGPTVAVVGEASYQDALSQITGSRRWEDVRADCVAVLDPEPSNRFDPNAVRVSVEGRQVGYLSRGDALAYRPALDAIDEVYEARVSCAAVIAGRGQGSETKNMGVFLKLPDPGEHFAQTLARCCEEQGIPPR